MRPEELHGVLRAHNGAGQDPERQAADQPDTALTADDLLGGGSDTEGGRRTCWGECAEAMDRR